MLSRVTLSTEDVPIRITGRHNYRAMLSRVTLSTEDVPIRITGRHNYRAMLSHSHVFKDIMTSGPVNNGAMIGRE